jgi:hypothetical protein
MSTEKSHKGTPAPSTKEHAKASARVPVVYPIVKYGDPVLETPGKPVETFDEQLAHLCEDMFVSMYAASGIGLAAPQI